MRKPNAEQQKWLMYGFLVGLVLVGLVLGVGSLVGEAPKPAGITRLGLTVNLDSEVKPRHKGARLRLSIAGDTMRAGWVYRAPLDVLDTAIVRFQTKAVTATSWTTALPNVRTRGTAAIKVIPILVGGDSVQVCVWVVRVGADPSPTSCVKKARTAGPHPGVDSLTISSVIVKPDSVKLEVGSTQQFCAAVRLSDDRVVLTTNSEGIAVCPTMFASVPGFTLSAVGLLIEDSSLSITIDGGEELVEEFPDGRRSPPYFIARVTVANAVKVGGEWWLTNPVPVPTAS